MATSYRSVQQDDGADRVLVHRAGIAWIVAGAFAGVLTLQLLAAPRSDASRLIPMWTGLIAVASLGYGAGLMRLPTRGLGWATVFSGFSVAWGVVALSSFGNVLFLAWIIATAVAGVLCLNARREMSEVATSGVTEWSARALPPAPQAAPEAAPPASHVPTEGTVPVRLDQVDVGLPQRVVTVDDPRDVAWGRLLVGDSVRLERDGTSLVVVGMHSGQILRWPQRQARCERITAGPLAGLFRWELGPLMLCLEPVSGDGGGRVDLSSRRPQRSGSVRSPGPVMPVA